MTLNDPLANVLSSIHHKEKIGATTTVIRPVSSLIKKVLAIMHEQKYLGTFTEIKDKKGNTLKLALTGSINKCGVVKPRFSVKVDEFEKFEKRYLPARDMGLLIVSTPKGVMTNSEAKKKGVGGKLIAYCY